MSDPKHPMQPVVWDDHDVIRFKRNDIVRFLLDNGGYDLNRLTSMPFSTDDWTQFMQLIGYSVSGAGDLSILDPAIIERADEEAARLVAARQKPI